MELVYLWVEEYKNIHKQGFNFSSKFICDYDEDSNELTINENDNYIENFFGDNINVTAIVGKNGSGKSQLLDLIIDLRKTNGIHKKLFVIILKDGKFILNYLDMSKITIIGKYSDISQNTLSRFDKDHPLSRGICVEDAACLNLSYLTFSPMLSNLHNRYNHCEIYTIYNTTDKNTDFNYENFFDDIFFDIHQLLENKIVREFFNITSKPDSIYLWFREDEKYKSEKSYRELEAYKVTVDDDGSDETYEIPLNRFTDEFKNAIISLKKIIYDNNCNFYLFYKMNSGSETEVHFSGGELALMFYIRSLNKIEDGSILLIDEFEAYLHPDWQKKFLSFLVEYFESLNKHVQVIITTHSPFLISDLPRENIIFLDNGKQVKGIDKKQTFGANIHTLLSDSFFMEDGLMGEFAKGKINEIIELHKIVAKEKHKKCLKKIYNKRKKNLWNTQSIIGEEYLKQVIKNHLVEIEKILLGKDMAKKEEIARTELYLESLKNA